MSLSPWPAASMTATRRQALDALRLAVGLPATTATGNAFDSADIRLERTAATVAAHVELYAAGAPAAAKDEAVIRGVAWLRDTQGAAAESSVGPLALKRPSNSAPWFLHSGAAAAVAPWRVRGVVTVAED